MLFVCRCRSRSVAWFSYWFDNLGLITEGNTYRRCAASSLPLWGITDVASRDIKRNFWHRCRGRSSTYTRFLITNLISSQFILFAICPSFSSPPLHKNSPFLFAPLFCSSFSCRIRFCVQYCLPLLSLWIVLHLLLALPRKRFSTLNKGEEKI